ncbi:glucans biosynthesis protein [Solimonas aquatica]|uniref:Glucans biosynthesis protein D n=1 Tax=Solimonas aquatica TaxID=489703 RepID=A0A1H9F6E4_9GAMM|nr:glucan biosynthesis protein D [Solimonas aquatica]SEQ32993.1 glucans biosynthesis protein [Solimonas aquatica]
MLNRRRFLQASSASLALAALGLTPEVLAAARLRLGKAAPYSYEGLVARAQAAAAQPYAPPPALPRAVLERIDYEAHGKIHYRPDYALFAQGPGAFPVTFFHLGRYFQSPVHMYAVDNSGGSASEILYDTRYFDMPADSPAHELPKGAGFAGFRFQESRLGDQAKKPWQKNDWVAFLGASYFRAIGELYQYGLSARGIALDVAQPEKPEEFPAFTHFYFEAPQDGSDSVVVCALLDGPSISGAYRFRMTRDKAVLTEIECALFLRRDVLRFGIAPASSMYWFSERARWEADDWRPEVHDSDGLAMWTGGGERIWRPLNNPPRTMASAFSDKTPRGFGLLQRDRSFDHYHDGVAYERRPSMWVEPIGDWGEGSVQLIEIPTDDEIHDNIVAMWVPKKPARAGDSYNFHYKLHWSAQEPYPGALAQCTATRLGRGGQPGQPRPQGVRKFMVEFLGGPLEKLPFGTKPEAVLWASRGQFSYVFTEAVPDDVPGHWRAQFDLTVDGSEPVDMRLYLRLGDKTLSETWLYQYHPRG